MRQRQNIISILCIFIFTAFSHAETVKLTDYLPFLPNGTSLSLIASTTDNNTLLFDHNSELMITPASTQKVVTALAALLQLGKEYRFQTTFETDGTVKQGELNGDLIVRFSGDPSFKFKYLQSMVDELHKKGIHKIHGRVILNASVFQSHDKARGWAWNDLTACYNAAPSAIVLDHNCFYTTLSPAAKAGQKGTLKISPYYPIEIVNDVMTVDTNSDAAKYCELDVIATEINRYRLTGCIKRDNQPITLAFAVQDSYQYTKTIIKRLFSEHKIEITGGVVFNQHHQNKGKVLLALHQSKPLEQLLIRMMKRSDNLYADAIFRTIGREYFGKASTWRSSADSVRAILLTKANIDLENSVIIDGSGLSRENLMTAKKLLELLNYIADHDQQLNLIEMFPISGIDGSLLSRSSMSSEPLKGVIAAKTGTLSGVYNLAGFITLSTGKKIAFVQFISGYSSPSEDIQERQKLLMSFEQQLYSALYNMK